jgi:single-stranded-DNA-specific exonuclease
MPSRARWIEPQADESGAARLARQCGLEMPAARVLWARGFRTPHEVERFLHPKLTHLEDPFQMRGMESAADRLLRAARAGERVLLYGDYDVDGVAGVVILMHMLEVLGLRADYHVPDRLRDGYGMQPAVVAQAARDGYSLIVSVDTGIRAFEAVEEARLAGADVIVTDHHLPEERLPGALAVLNPNQPGCAYPNKNLCGAGVAFKLAQALMERAGWPPERIVRFTDSFLIMAAVATVADVVPLTGENRVIVKRGLEGIAKTRNPGLRALLEVSGFPPGAALTSGDLGFRVAPRINAAGRMDHAREVIELFLTRDEMRAREIARRLDELNAERQRTGDAIVREILGRYGEAGPPADKAGLVFYSPEWHRGVVGIVANRVAEYYHRPVIVLGRDENTGFAQGSGRSIPGFHLLSALEKMADVFEKFGGHRQAVGVTLAESRVEELEERFNGLAREWLTEADLEPELRPDAELRLDELSDKAAGEVLALEPFGHGNRQPVFLLRGVEVRQAEGFGKSMEHVRARLWQGARSLFVRAWRSSARLEELREGARIDAAITIEEDAWSAQRGFAPWSAAMRDFRPAHDGSAAGDGADDQQGLVSP